MRSLLKERIRAAVDLVGDALRGEISDRRDFIESLRREYESKALKPLWCFSDDPYDEELAFIYAVGKQVAAEEVSELREVFALEVGADAVISAILSGRDARDALRECMGASGAREVLAVSRLAASYDLIEQGGETLPQVLRSLSASIPELDDLLLRFKRYYASIWLAAMYALGSADEKNLEALAESLALRLGDVRAKAIGVIASRIATEIFGVKKVPATPSTGVFDEVLSQLDKGVAEAWRSVYSQLVTRLTEAGKPDAERLAEVLVREAINRGVDPASIDAASVDPQNPLEAWRRYLNLDWRLSYAYLNIRSEYEVRLERAHDFTVLGRLHLVALRSIHREKLSEMVYQWLIGSGTKPKGVSDDYLRAEIEQLAEGIVRHARSLTVRQAHLTLASKRVEVSGVPVELGLHAKRHRLYLQLKVANRTKIVVRVDSRSVERTLDRLRNALRNALPPKVRGIAEPLEREIGEFLRTNLWGGH
ncbi:MAG: DUF2192 domain-containing protein [Thermofilaceae archaeon]